MFLKFTKFLKNVHTLYYLLSYHSVSVWTELYIDTAPSLMAPYYIMSNVVFRATELLNVHIVHWFRPKTGFREEV